MGYGGDFLHYRQGMRAPRMRLDATSLGELVPDRLRGHLREAGQRVQALPRRAVLVNGGILAVSTALIGAGTLDLIADGEQADAAGVASGPGATAESSFVVSTGAWGARPAERKAIVRSRPPRYVVIHHTSTRNVADYSRAWAYRLARGIQRSHQARGWGDSGQHFTISRGGYVLEGRTGSFAAARMGRMTIGTHVRNTNDDTVGIECEGNYNHVMPPRALIDSLVRMCAWLCVQYDLDPDDAIVPHRKFNDTDCCGDTFVAALPRLRRQVAEALSDRRRG
jgi:hypothetical protein